MAGLTTGLPNATLVNLIPARQRSGTVTGAGIAVTAYEGTGIVILDWLNESGTTPTLDVKLQESDTVGGTYTDVASGAFSQVTTGSGVAKLAVNLDAVKPFLRALGTFGGTSPVYAAGVNLLAYKKNQP